MSTAAHSTGPAARSGDGAPSRGVRFALAVIAPIATVILALAIAEAMKAGGMLPKTVPAPTEVWSDFQKTPSVLTRSLWATTTKALIGYGIAAAVATLAAAIAALIAALRNPIYNFGVALHSIPLIATTPLLALWLGATPRTHIIIAALACYFPMLVGAMQGFRAAERTRLELFHVYSASPLQRFRYLLFPSALPYLFAGFKIAAPSAILGTLTAEWAGAEIGIGVLMLHSLFAFDVPKVWLAVITACALSAAGYGVWALLERVVVYWESPTELRD